MKFDELGLSEKVLKAVEASGYDTPTPIQEQAIPHALQGRDVLGIAQTGTGKTAAFTLPMLSMLEKGRARARMPRTLILEPTRELAAQVEEAFAKYGVNHKLNLALLIGGVSFGDQEAKITRGADVLIATPGPAARLRRARQDPAHRHRDPRHRRSRPHARHGLHSRHRAHLQAGAVHPPDPVLLGDHAAGNHPRSPSSSCTIRCASKSPGPPRPATNITQTLVRSGGDARGEARDAAPPRSAAPRTSRTRSSSATASATCRSSIARWRSTASPSARCTATSTSARAWRRSTRSATDEVQLLVCSDVAARGLDIPDVSHVINFDAPHHAEDYVHRIGRTGRAGKTGAALTIVTRADTRGDRRDREADRAQDRLCAAASERRRRDDGRGGAARRAARAARARQGRGHDRPRRHNGAEPLHRTTHGHRATGSRSLSEAKRRSAATRDAAPAPGRAGAACPPGRARASARASRRSRAVVGLGDHVPSFLLRPTRAPRRPAAGRSRGLSDVSGRVRADAVAAFRLGAVERLVGARDRARCGRCVSRRSARPIDAVMLSEPSAVARSRTPPPRSPAARARRCASPPSTFDARHHDDEFLAAEPAQEVAAADDAAQPVGERPSAPRRRRRGRRCR